VKRSKRLERINAINVGIENAAGARLADAAGEYSRHVNQLEQLRIYKDDYATQLQNKMQDGMSPQALRDFHYFFASIDNAITQQQAMVEHLRRKLEHCQQEWFDKRNEVEKINVAGASLKRAEDLAATRAEQKASDELGLRRSGGRHSLLSL
jgi:flagellar export protein FliJ